MEIRCYWNRGSRGLKYKDQINQNEMWISSMAKEVEKAKEVIIDED